MWALSNIARWALATTMLRSDDGASLQPRHSPLGWLAVGLVFAGFAAARSTAGWRCARSWTPSSDGETTPTTASRCTWTNCSWLSDMTLVDLSARVGVTVANLSILKNGHARAVRFSTLTAICEALHCTPGELQSRE